MKNDCLPTTTALIIFTAMLFLQLVFVLPCAISGSADDPEITDAEGDADPGDLSGSEMCDLICAYIDTEDESVFKVSLKVAALPSEATDTALLLAYAPSWSFCFTCNGTQYRAVCTYTTSGHAYALSGGAGGKLQGSAGGSVISMYIPKEKVGARGGENLSELYAEVTGDYVTDRAPDSGYGREYTILSFEPEISLESPQPQKGVKAGGIVQFSIIINNAGLVGTNVSLAAEASDSAWNAEINGDPFHMEAETYETRILTVTAPEDAAIGNTCGIKVSSGNATLNLTAEVVTVAVPTLSSDYLQRTIEPGGKTEFIIYVVNNDRDDWRFDLSAEADLPGWGLEFDPGALDVAGGGNYGESLLVVTAPTDAGGSATVTVSTCGATLNLTVNAPVKSDENISSGGNDLGFPGTGTCMGAAVAAALIIAITKKNKTLRR
ncbi:MAG: hypothetical protein CVT48_02885 [Thermoplasmata archaeon HGW-Thermoplasmata-1]|nr:MAG: hypothetical protein CVT48_02885 [Thermoplasmata archaeon HGW-Thermoplasmata-1]